MCSGAMPLAASRACHTALDTPNAPSTAAATSRRGGYSTPAAVAWSAGGSSAPGAVASPKRQL
eukprot:6559390-Prymnesium_polylepis.1